MIYFVTGAVIGICGVALVCKKKKIDTTIVSSSNTLKFDTKYFIGKGIWYIVGGGLTCGLIGVGLKYIIDKNKNKNKKTL